MNRLILVGLALVLAAGVSCSQADRSATKPAVAKAQAQPAVPVVTPVVAPAPVAAKQGTLAVAEYSGAVPKIDGMLDDAIWAKAAQTTMFLTAEGGKPSVQTKLYAAQDKDNLYLAVQCFVDPKKVKDIVAAHSGHDEHGLWEDDDVEIFLDPANKRVGYYQIVLNPKGATYDSYHAEAGPGSTTADLSWEPKYQSAAKVGTDSWVVELVLPFAVFNRTATSASTWAFNVLREVQPAAELIYFSPTGGNAQQPDKFGTLSDIKTTWQNRAVEKPKAP